MTFWRGRSRRARAGGVVLHRRRHQDAVEPGEVDGQRLQIAGFQTVVELPQQALAQLHDDVPEAEAAPGIRVPIHRLGDLLQDLQVLHHLLLDPRTLHLHRHRPPAAQDGPMDLAQGGGGHRRLLEIGEGLRHLHAQLGGDDGLDLGEREGLDLVLEPGEGVEDRRREQVRPRGEELADLDVGRSEALEVGTELRGQRLLVHRHHRDAIAGRLGESSVFDKVRPAVLQEQDRDVLVALQVVRLH